MIGRLVRRGVQAGLLVLIVTIGAVLYFSDANLRAFGDGRALDGPVDVILVLGGAVEPDGIAGYSSRRRAAAAVELLKAGKTRYVIFSGGPDWADPESTAAGLMRKHAVALGAPPETLLIEPDSATTFENLRFSLRIAEERGFARIALLTDAFHLERARYLAHYFGRDDAVPVAVRGLEWDGDAERVWSILREALAWWYNLYKVAGWEVLALAGYDAEARREIIR